MSLINKMLKDLEQRGETPGNTDEEVVAVVKPVKDNGNKRLPLLLLLLLVAILGAVWYLYPKLTTKKEEKAKADVKPPMTITRRPPKTEKFVKTKEPFVVLKGVTFERKDNEAVINLGLSTETPLYTVENSKDGRTLFVTLSNAVFGNDFAEISENMFINTFSVSKVSDEVVRITIGLNPGVTVKSLEMLSKPSPGLEITLSGEGDEFAALMGSTDASGVHKTERKLSKDELAKTQYESALETLSKGEVDSAISQLNKIVNANPDYHDARVGLVTLLLKKSEEHQAIALLNVGLKRSPQYLPFIELKAQALAYSDRQTQAIKLMEKHLPEISAKPNYYGLLAAIYQQVGNHASAGEIYTRLVKLQRVKAVWWVGLGVSLESMGKKNAAFTAYNRALSRPDLSPDLRSYLNDKMNR